MTTATNTPLIIKRKKVVAGDGHHGGAWKVAYADFVTAMMAFFMLMWLLNATTEQQRKGIADYFAPDIPIARVSGGGSGALNGESLAEDGAVMPHLPPPATAEPADLATLAEIADRLQGQGGESLIPDDVLRHVVSEVTDEGLVIELFDRAGAHLFAPGTAVPQPLARDLARALVMAFADVPDDVAVAAHVRSDPVIIAEARAWPLTMQRADAFRRLLEEQGLTPARVRRATGHADRDLAVADPMAPRNDRIEVILLRPPTGWRRESAGR